MATSGVDAMVSARGAEMKAGGPSHDRRTKVKTMFKNGKKIRVIHKPDGGQVRWTVRQKANGQTGNAETAEPMGVSGRRVRKPWPGHGSTRPGDITRPPQAGRPVGGPPGRRGHSAVLPCCSQGRRTAARPETIVERSTGIHITHHTIHGISRDGELAESRPAKAGRRKWVRYGRRCPNSLRHTDCKRLPDGGWFVSFRDDASRPIAGFGVFGEAAGDHATRVPEGAIRRRGKPAQALTDHGSQSYANEENAGRGVAAFETGPVGLGTRHAMARIGHPRASGRLERFRPEMERHPRPFEDESASDTVRNVKPGDHVGGPFHAAGHTRSRTSRHHRLRIKPARRRSRPPKKICDGYGAVLDKKPPKGTMARWVSP